VGGEEREGEGERLHLTLFVRRRINLDSLDCQTKLQKNIVNERWVLVFLCLFVCSCLRVLNKTYQASNKKDKNLKSLLKKKPARVALYSIMTNFPVILMCAIKLQSPNKVLMDPKTNPAFFVFMIFCLNAEWWVFALIFSSVVGPIIKGIHKQSNRDTIVLVANAKSLAERIPLVDMMLRIVLIIIPALIGAATDNAFNITVITFLFQRVYSCAKLVIFISMFLRCANIAIGTLDVSNEENEQRSTSSTGSTDTKLKNFKAKVKMNVILVPVGLALYAIYRIYTIFNESSASWFYTNFAYDFLQMRSGIAGSQIVVFELLYLDALHSLVKFYRGLVAGEGSSEDSKGDIGVSSFLRKCTSGDQVEQSNPVD